MKKGMRRLRVKLIKLLAGEDISIIGNCRFSMGTMYQVYSDVSKNDLVVFNNKYSGGKLIVKQ